MCTLLRFRRDPPPLEIRMLLGMMIDDLQILALNDSEALYVSARLIAERADAVRPRLGAPSSSDPPYDDLHRFTMRKLQLLAAHDAPTLRVLAIEITDLAQTVRIQLAGSVRSWRNAGHRVQAHR